MFIGPLAGIARTAARSKRVLRVTEVSGGETPTYQPRPFRKPPQEQPKRHKRFSVRDKAPEPKLDIFA